MARVTVEDCITIVPNRFELILMAAERTKAIASGSPIVVDRENDKNSVVALKEIAQKKIRVDMLRDAMIKRNQKNIVTDPAALQYDQEDGGENAMLAPELENIDIEDVVEEEVITSDDDGSMDIYYDDEIEVSDTD